MALSRPWSTRMGRRLDSLTSNFYNSSWKAQVGRPRWPRRLRQRRPEPREHSLPLQWASCCTHESTWRRRRLCLVSAVSRRVRLQRLFNRYSLYSHNPQVFSSTLEVHVWAVVVCLNRSMCNSLLLFVFECAVLRYSRQQRVQNQFLRSQPNCIEYYF